MKNIIDWASERARMVLFFVVLSLIAGFYSYFNLPKEGEPDIEIPVVFISVPFQGISAEHVSYHLDEAQVSLRASAQDSDSIESHGLQQF